MAVDKLLRELEPLTHAGRVRRMIELGHSSRADARVATTLAALRQGSFYERWLALLSCHGSRDGDHVLQALGDASRIIRGLAIRTIPVVCDDAQARAALEAATERQRRALLLRLARRSRTAPIDDFLAAQASRDPSRFSALLPFGSAATVEQHLETVADQADAGDWRRLARWHPQLAADALCRRAAAAQAHDLRLIWHANAALPELAERAPLAALSFVDELVRHAAPARLVLNHLARRQPVAMAERALGGPAGHSVYLGRRPSEPGANPRTDRAATHRVRWSGELVRPAHSRAACRSVRRVRPRLARCGGPRGA